MKRAEIKNRHADGVTFDTQIVPNPANTKEWIVLFKKDEGLSFFLVDEHEQVESFSCLDEVVQVLRELGIKNAEVHV